MTTYVKQTWIDNNVSYPVSAARMNHIEDGIDSVTGRVDTLEALATIGRVTVADYNLQAGVVGVSDGRPSRLSSSSVRVAGGSIWVPDGSATICRNVKISTTDFIDISINTPGNYRVDTLVVSSSGVVSRLAGTEAAAVISDLDSTAATASRASITSSQLVLGEFIVSNTGVGSLQGISFRDRRRFARGYRYLAQTDGGGFGGTASTFEYDAGLRQRVECNGNPFRVTYAARQMSHSSAVTTTLMLYMDGAHAVDTLGHTKGTEWVRIHQAANLPWPLVVEAEIKPPIGSHLFTMFQSSTNNGFLQIEGHSLLIDEILHPNPSWPGGLNA